MDNRSLNLQIYAVFLLCISYLTLGGVICSALEIIGGLGLSSRLIVSFQT
jgi:hypothetical protein